MKKKYILLVISTWLILLLTGCAKQEIKQIVKPLDNIPMASAKNIKFSNYTIRSENKELGRTKTVTEKQDMENIVKYIKTLSCTESTRKVKDSDYEIRLSNVTGDYMYSIQVSKNQLYVYGGGTDPDISVFDYKDPELIKELERVYKEINYKEILIMRK